MTGNAGFDIPPDISGPVRTAFPEGSGVGARRCLVTHRLHSLVKVMSP